jgi:hypothetical protein
MNRYLAALLVVLAVVGVVGVLAVGRGFADEENAAKAKCSKATLHGTYLFAQDGVDIFGKDQVPFSIAGMEKYDGNGKVKLDATGNFNGNVVHHERLSGTYTVKADCTGTSTYTTPDGALRGDMFIDPDGSKLTFVQTNPPSR